MHIRQIVARHSLDKHVPAATNTHDNKIVERVFVGLCIPLSLLANGLGKQSLWQLRIVGGVVFYVVRVVTKESIRLVLSRTSCSINVSPD
jgi:hypothetical protein